MAASLRESYGIWTKLRKGAPSAVARSRQEATVAFWHDLPPTPPPHSLPGFRSKYQFSEPGSVLTRH